MDFLSLFSNAWSIFLVVIFFGGSIFVHELGHFLAARRRGLKVERFSIGFGPKIFSWQGKDGVEYRLSWIPLGGYVALPQLADLRQLEGAAEVTEKEKVSVPYSAKVEVLVAGAVFNILFATLLACVIWITGYPVVKSDLTTQIGYVASQVKLPDGREVPSPASLAGFKIGDRILSIDGRKTERWRNVPQAVVLGGGRDKKGNPETVIAIDRDGQILTLTAHPYLIGDVDKVRTLGIAPADDLTIDQVAPKSPAEQTGLRAGDKLIGVNGTPVFSMLHVHELVQANRDQPAALAVLREGKTVHFTVTPRVEKVRIENGKNSREESVWRMGVRWIDQKVLINDPPFRMLGEHFVQMWQTVGALVDRHSDVGISKMSGPVGIGRGFHQMAQVDWRLLLWFTTLVNVNLALMNLLPIPVLDGGHILFATIARIRGRALPAELLAKVTTAFLFLLLGLIVYVTTFDFRRWASDLREDAKSSAPAQPVPEKP
jgi:regulator of sigma E protease